MKYSIDTRDAKRFKKYFQEIQVRTGGEHRKENWGTSKDCQY
jgi:hypothetical protein